MSAPVETAIRTHLAQQWDATRAAIRPPNETFRPGEAPWIEIRFPGSREERGDIGEAEAPLWNERGAFMVDVYIPANVPAGDATALADAVWTIFKGQEVEGVRCDARLAGHSGPREAAGVDGLWWGVSYGIEYRYQSIG